jgi:hypothetical protein
MSRRCAYSDFAHLGDNTLLQFVLSLGNDGSEGGGDSGKAAKSRANAAADAKKLSKLQNMRDENGEKISTEQKTQILRMIQRLEEMQELAFAERQDLTDRIARLSKKLADAQISVERLERENQVTRWKSRHLLCVCTRCRCSVARVARRAGAVACSGRVRGGMMPWNNGTVEHHNRCPGSVRVVGVGARFGAPRVSRMSSRCARG